MRLELGSQVFLPIIGQQDNIKTQQRKPNQGYFIVQATITERSSNPNVHVLCGKKRHLDVIGGYCTTYEKAVQLILQSGLLQNNETIELLDEIKPGTPTPFTDEVQMA